MTISMLACDSRTAPWRRPGDRTRIGADLSDPSDHAGRAVPGRRRQRRAGAAGRRADEQDARPAGRGREPRRRRRHGRDARDRQEPARRPHDPALLHRHVRHQSDALSQRRLRSAQGFRADRLDRDADQRAGDASVAAGAIDRRADRLRQGQSRQDQLRLRARNRRPYLDRDVRAQRRHQAHQHPLQGQRQRHRRPARRPCLDDVPLDPAGDRADPGRHAQCAGGREPGALVAHPERADDCGVGRARLLGGHHLRARGAGGHAARDRRAAEQGAAGGARRRDAAQAARCRRRRRCCRARRRTTPP